MKSRRENDAVGAAEVELELEWRSERRKAASDILNVRETNYGCCSGSVPVPAMLHSPGSNSVRDECFNAITSPCLQLPSRFN